MKEQNLGAPCSNMGILISGLGVFIPFRSGLRLETAQTILHKEHYNHIEVNTVELLSD